MNEPMILKSQLLQPIIATRKNLIEIMEQVKLDNAPIVLNGLFVMSVSCVECMMNETLAYYLNKNPNKLPEKLNITKQDLLENQFAILNSFVKEYVRKVSYDNISNYMDVYFKNLSIEQPGKEIVNRIMLIKEKRNSIVHDNLFIDYKQKRVNLANLSPKYVYNAIVDLELFVRFLEEQIEVKYSKYTKINLLRNLWAFTFHSPLLSNFDNYWYIDEDNDCLSGFKNTKVENQLSSSEKMLLDIWRSQLQSGYNVRFLNMSSLDSDSQYKMQLFLSISNDLFMY